MTERALPFTLLSLDPGETTGFAEFDVTEDDPEEIPELRDYGTIPRTKDLHSEYLGEIKWWVQRHADNPFCEVQAVFEEALSSSKVRSTVEGLEIRGVIREAARSQVVATYHPSTVKAAFRARTKVELRRKLELMLAHRITSMDHAVDAIAIGLCHLNAVGIFDLKSALVDAGVWD